MTSRSRKSPGSSVITSTSSAREPASIIPSSSRDVTSSKKIIKQSCANKITATVGGKTYFFVISFIVDLLNLLNLGSSSLGNSRSTKTGSNNSVSQLMFQHN